MRDPSGLDLLRSHDFPKPLLHNVWSKIIMPFLGRLSDLDSQQNPALSRRELLVKSLAIGAVSLLPADSQSKFPYPPPEFKIGDLVASDWEPDDDDAPEWATDYGEILGMRWLLNPEGSWAPAHTWVYYVNWTHGTCGSDICYPCYDGELTRACDLRLVKQS
jgi:hypothetical protein